MEIWKSHRPVVPYPPQYDESWGFWYDMQQQVESRPRYVSGPDDCTPSRTRFRWRSKTGSKQSRKKVDMADSGKASPQGSAKTDQAKTITYQGYTLMPDREILEGRDLQPRTVNLPVNLVNIAVRESVYRHRDLGLLRSVYNRVVREAETNSEDDPDFARTAILATAVGFVPTNEEMISREHLNSWMSRQRLMVARDEYNGESHSEVLHAQQPETYVSVGVDVLNKWINSSWFVGEAQSTLDVNLK